MLRKLWKIFQQLVFTPLSLDFITCLLLFHKSGLDLLQDYIICALKAAHFRKAAHSHMYLIYSI